MKSLLEILTASTDYLAKNGVENPRLNAEHLLAHALGKKRLELYLEFDRPLSEAELAPMRELIRKRGQGQPLQHLLGTAEFYGRVFTSDARALIPRPETEQLVEMVLADCKKAGMTAPVICDIGTGTGIIAVTLALELPEAKVTAVDVSPDALSLAKLNAEKLGASERVQFVESDLLGAAPGQYDWIVANLPYIAREVIPTLAREVQSDPVLALDGGLRGTELIERLLEQAQTHMVPGGRIALEIGHDQSDYLIEKLQSFGYHGVEARPDYSGVQRFLFAIYG